MRNQPYLDDLEEILPSRYTMVIAIAKRARQIMQEEREQDENGYTGITKPVSIAMYELLDRRFEVTEKPFEKKEIVPKSQIQDFSDFE